MGLFFALLYILTAYLSPPVVFGPLAEYHAEILIAALATIVSIPAFLESNLLRLPQTIAIGGMTFAVFASLVAGGWIGGAPAAVYEFLPNVFIYFLIVLHCKTKRHLQLIVFTLLFVAAFVTWHGWFALRANDIKSLYLYDQGVGDGKTILRLRGLSFISDPNDFSQLLVSLLPAVFFFWKSKSTFRNVILVLFPMSLVMYAMYLTHSRGAVIALLVVVILASRRKLGNVLSLVLAAGMFLLSSATDWSGGREISIDAGSDRMDAWAMGLQLIKSHPIFGVGIFRFGDYNQITAHNTVVVCAAELGFVGLLFWVLFVLCSMKYGVSLSARQDKPSEEGTDFGAQAFGRYAEATVLSPQMSMTNEEPAFSVPGGSSFGSFKMVTAEVEGSGTSGGVRRPAPHFIGNEEQVEPGKDEEAEIRRMAMLMVITLSGYLAAGWFLSRAYVMTLFVYGGMMQVLFRMAVNQGFAPRQPSMTRLFWMSVGLSIFLLLFVYAILHLKKFLP